MYLVSTFVELVALHEQIAVPLVVPDNTTVCAFVLSFFITVEITRDGTVQARIEILIYQSCVKGCTLEACM